MFFATAAMFELSHVVYGYYRLVLICDAIVFGTGDADAINKRIDECTIVYIAVSFLIILISYSSTTHNIEMHI